MALFNENEFYPTPRGVIEKMLQGANVTDKVILEPSAGSGNIVDLLSEFGAKEVLACEQNDKLRRILSQKCDIIGTDFFDLDSEQVSHIDEAVPYSY